ncbi:hypothetical protein PIB30_089296 [Stylosanthes scabra]|uniref:Uncharacterized protein n=1 Tax=Stylosanthes scabra TaxID=79078 RepID=A0ABU6QTF3_9FABA|nr:hypothetical protein [Stylosanthes scabra]
MALLISVLRGVICSGIFSGPAYHWSEPVISLITLLESCRMIYMTKSRKLQIYHSLMGMILGLSFIHEEEDEEGVAGEEVVPLVGEEDVVEGDRSEVVVWMMMVVLLELVCLELEHMRIHWMLRTSLRSLGSLPNIHMLPWTMGQGLAMHSMQILRYYYTVARGWYDDVVSTGSGMHDTPPVASSHVSRWMHGIPPVASPHAFVGSHTFDQLHGTPPGSHVTGSSSGGSGSHGGKFTDLYTFRHDTVQAYAGQPFAKQHDADK